MTIRKIRVGVSAHDFKFWRPLQKGLEAKGKYEFREDVWTGHDSFDATESQALLDWADVLVAEWALGNAVYYSRHKRPGQRLIIRLHQQERHTEFLNYIHYDNVERILFVGRHIMEDCQARFPIPKDKCSLLGNFVDTRRFDLAKMGGSEFTLGMIGIAPKLKGLDRALDLLEILAERDDRYRLRVKGPSPASIPWLWRSNEERDYYEKVFERINSGPLKYRVNFDPKGDDVEHWLKYVGFILSPSAIESFHMALAEGAASAAVPVLWKREGVESIFPEFEPLEDVRAAAEWIEFHNRSAAGHRMRAAAKRIISARYCREGIVERWGGLLDGQVKEHTPQTAVARVNPKHVLVVWAIDDWAVFHRSEMLVALSENLGPDFHLLVIEPGNYFSAIVKQGWAGEDELRRVAGGELLSVSANISRTRLITGGVSAGVEGASSIIHTSEVEVLDRILWKNFPGVGTAFHWIYKPDQAERLGSRPYIYEVYDDYTLDFSTGVPHPGVAELERETIRAARHVFFTSPPLQQRKQQAEVKSSLVGNGVNYPVFAKYRTYDGTRSGRPVAGYLGNLSDFFDWHLMQAVCEAMPGIDFVFHGQIEAHRLGERESIYQAMRALSNVRFSGRVSRVLGASSIARYDVALIPFVVNEAIDAVNPLKLWEYLATGLPVVSTPMEAIQEPEPLVITADGADAWVAAINRAISPEFNEASAIEARVARAKAHSWAELTRSHANIVKSLR